MSRLQGLKPNAKLEALAAELRGLPRHLWDERLWQFCEQFVEEGSKRRDRQSTESAPRMRREVRSSPA